MEQIQRMRAALARVHLSPRAPVFWTMILVVSVIICLCQVFVSVYVYTVVKEGIKGQYSAQEQKIEKELELIYQPKEVDKVLVIIDARKKRFDELMGMSVESKKAQSQEVEKKATQGTSVEASVPTEKNEVKNIPSGEAGKVVDKKMEEKKNTQEAAKEKTSTKSVDKKSDDQKSAPEAAVQKSTTNDVVKKEERQN